MEIETPVHPASLREVINGLVYKSIQTELEVSQCYQLYQKSFMKGDILGSSWSVWFANFITDEPITRNFRDKEAQTAEEIKFFDNELFYGPVSDGVSLIVVDPEAGNRVVGMRISAVVDRLALPTENKHKICA